MTDDIVGEKRQMLLDSQSTLLASGVVKSTELSVEHVPLSQELLAKSSKTENLGILLNHWK